MRGNDVVLWSASGVSRVWGLWVVWALTGLLSAAKGGRTLGPDRALQTAVGPGDLAVVTLSNGEFDGFTLVATRSIPAGAEIFVTDQAWLGEKNGGFRSTEGVLGYLVGAEGLSAGELIHFDSRDFAQSSWQLSGQFALSRSGDSLIVYSGSSLRPTFIAAICDFDECWSDANTDIDSGGSSLPEALVEGQTALCLLPSFSLDDNGTRIDEAKQAVYTGVREGSAVEVLQSVYNFDNWAYIDEDNMDWMTNFNIILEEENNDTESGIARLVVGVLGTTFFLAGLWVAMSHKRNSIAKPPPIAGVVGGAHTGHSVDEAIMIPSRLYQANVKRGLPDMLVNNSVFRMNPAFVQNRPVPAKVEQDTKQTKRVHRQSSYSDFTDFSTDESFVDSLIFVEE